MTDIHDLAPLYAVDALDGDELAEFETHYDSCDQCRQEVAEVREAMAAVDASAPIDPPPSLKAAVMTEIGGTARSPAASRIWLRSALALAAAALVVAGLAIVLVRDSTPTVSELASVEDAVELDLIGADDSIRAIFSDERDQVGLVAVELAEPGRGLVYALWFLRPDGSVRSAGLFEPDDGGALAVVLDIDDVASTGFGVTIEPAGGSDQPTSDVIYSGQFAS